MSKHGLQLDRQCPWCLKLFADRRAVDAHATAKHPHSFARTDESMQRGALQKLHQDRVAERKASHP